MKFPRKIKKALKKSFPQIVWMEQPPWKSIQFKLNKDWQAYLFYRYSYIYVYHKGNIVKTNTSYKSLKQI